MPPTGEQIDAALGYTTALGVLSPAPPSTAVAPSTTTTGHWPNLPATFRTPLLSL